MKKFIPVFAALAIMFLASCENHYSCKCTHSYNIDGETSSYVQTSDLGRIKTRDAENQCDEMEVPSSAESTVDCKLSRL